MKKKIIKAVSAVIITAGICLLIIGFAPGQTEKAKIPDKFNTEELQKGLETLKNSFSSMGRGATLLKVDYYEEDSALLENYDITKGLVLRADFKTGMFDSWKGFKPRKEYKSTYWLIEEGSAWIVRVILINEE